MKKIIQLVRDGHVGPTIFGRVVIGDSTFLSAEPVEGSLPAGKYQVHVGPQGGVFADETYPFLDGAMGKFAPAGLRIGLHYDNKGWDLTDKVTITNFVKSEIAKALAGEGTVELEVTYRKYDGPKRGKKVIADASGS